LYLKIIIFNKSYAFLEINYFTNVFFKFVILPKFFNYYEFFFFKKKPFTSYTLGWLPG